MNRTAARTGVVRAARAALYGVLSGIFARELPQIGWSSLREDTSRRALRAIAAECGVEADAEPLLEFLVARAPDDPAAVAEALAVDYAWLFIGPGPGLAPPYESVYTSPGRRFYGEALSEVTEALRDEGMAVDGEFGAPADHLAVELSFMQYLCDGGAPQAGGAVAEPSSRERRQREFLDRHLLRWTPAWAADVVREDRTGFYRAAGGLLLGFLRSDRARLTAEEDVNR